MQTIPRVDILMAIYKPNIKWLTEQLISLNNQTYRNLNLIVWNDCSEDETDYEKIYKNYITKFKYKIYKGAYNLGSNKAFEELTKLANGKFVAYCDQDDVWLPEKISILIEEIQKTNADLVCSDMYVVDKNSKIIADKIIEVRPHQIFYKGANLFEYLFSKNFVTGCTTLVKAEFAKTTLPFPNEYVHDWWLALCAASYGKLQIVEKSLIKYRIHDFNQTGILGGIDSKEDYYNKRIKLVKERSRVLTERFGCIDSIAAFKEYIQYRDGYYKKHSLKNFYKLFKLRKFNKLTTYFELALPLIPNIVFKFILRQIRKGRI